jgi:flagellar basal body P-ring protein FlgI
MYTVFSQIYMVNKIKSFLIFFSKNKHDTIFFFFFNIYLRKNNSLTRVLIHVSNWTLVLNTRVQFDMCIIRRVQFDTRIKYTCPIRRVYFYTRPNTRVQLDTSIKYTCPIVKMVQLDTFFIRHVSNWTRVYGIPIV